MEKLTQSCKFLDFDPPARFTTPREDGKPSIAIWCGIMAVAAAVSCEYQTSICQQTASIGKADAERQPLLQHVLEYLLVASTHDEASSI